jgi:UPF0755 protein
MNPWLARFLTLLAFLGLFAGVFWYGGHLLTPVGRSGEKVLVDIPLGSSARSIGKVLKEKGLIRSELAFVGFARLYGASTEMKAGEYEIPNNLGLIQMIDKLVAGDAVQHWVVIPEGKTVRQIAVLLENNRLGRSGAFLTAAGRRPQRYGMELPVPRASVEGYLMPDSYKFPRNVTERDMIRAMLRNWNEKVYRPHRELFAADELGADKIVIIASMIEREARVPEDRPLISAVIRNRLKRKMPLQIDATVLYALGSHKPVVTFEDLKVDHPYNTYRNPGLPPGPICNPGVAAVEAALKPASEDYLYYVARPDGSHIFTRSYQEHQAAIQQVRQMRKSGAAEAATAGE